MFDDFKIWKKDVDSFIMRVGSQLILPGILFFITIIITNFIYQYKDNNNTINFNKLINVRLKLIEYEAALNYIYIFYFCICFLIIISATIKKYLIKYNNKK